MLILIIDTSTERGVVAIANKFDVLFVQELTKGALSSRHLLSSIQTGFQTLKISAKDLSRIGVGVGPGMFTGIRVGVATAQGIAFGQKIPLIGFSSLRGFISSEEGLFASVIDARVGGAYLLLQQRVGNKILQMSEPMLVPISELKEKIKGCCVVGPSFDKLLLENAFEVAPDTSHLARVIDETPLDTPFELLYLREHL